MLENVWPRRASAMTVSGSCPLITLHVPGAVGLIDQNLSSTCNPWGLPGSPCPPLQGPGTEPMRGRGNQLLCPFGTMGAGVISPHLLHPGLVISDEQRGHSSLSQDQKEGHEQSRLGQQQPDATPGRAQPRVRARDAGSVPSAATSDSPATTSRWSRSLNGGMEGHSPAPSPQDGGPVGPTWGARAQSGC